jgi:hypothetical protein
MRPKTVRCRKRRRHVIRQTARSRGPLRTDAGLRRSTRPKARRPRHETINAQSEAFPPPREPGDGQKGAATALLALWPCGLNFLEFFGQIFAGQNALAKKSADERFEGSLDLKGAGMFIRFDR